MSKKQILALFVCGLVPWTVTHVHHWDMPDCRCDRSIGSYPFWYARGWSGCTSRGAALLECFLPADNRRRNSGACPHFDNSHASAIIGP